MNLICSNNLIDLVLALNWIIFSFVEQLWSLAIAVGYISISCKGNEIFQERLSPQFKNINILSAYPTQCKPPILSFPPLKLP